MQKKPVVLVIGGRGYIGSHIVKHLKNRGANVIIGSRQSGQRQRAIVLHKIIGLSQWCDVTADVDVVVNAVGILRQRFNETYDCVHHTAVANLARACAINNARFIHVSALGLENNATSRFLTSKLKGERAIKKIQGDWFIVRPSLVDGANGFGARWFRCVANWPVHMAPKNAKAILAPINIDDLGQAIAQLALTQQKITDARQREYDLGGDEQFGIFEYLNRLAIKPALLQLRIPSFVARPIAHLCDLLHITPYSYGHYELLKQDNIPAVNRLRELLNRPATPVGIVDCVGPEDIAINHI